MYLCTCKRGANSGHSDAGKDGGFTYARAANRTRYRENGGGRKRGEGMGKWGDIVGVVVVGGVGGSTGCPECTEVSRGRCKRGKEWQRMFVFR